MEIFLEDSASTEALGRCVGKFLRSGDVLCLNGDLGAGKTLLTRGAASALGAEPEDVNSPTFAIMNIYRGKNFEVRHFDLYRLQRVEELEDIGFYEYAGGEGVTVIEWAELFADELPEEYLEIILKRELDGRRAFLRARGRRGEEIIAEVRDAYTGD